MSQSIDSDTNKTQKEINGRSNASSARNNYTPVGKSGEVSGKSLNGVKMRVVKFPKGPQVTQPEKE